MKSSLFKQFLFGIVLSAVVFPSSAVAAIEIFAKQPDVQVNVGDTVLIDIALNSEDEINVIDGSISISEPSAISSITTGGSMISLWTQKPTLKNNTISFAGGSPSSAYGRSLKLFTLAITPQTVRPIRITFNTINAYRSDGKGSRMAVTGTAEDITVRANGDQQSENQYQSLVDTDNTPPLPFSIEIGQSDTLYDGKYFITFFTSDESTGLSHYIIDEGSLPEVRTDQGLYILQNQTLSGIVKVRAVDYAGNERTEKVNLDGSMQISWVKGGIFLAFLILISALFFVGYRKRNNRANNVYK